MENEFIFEEDLHPEGKIELTRAEIDALSEYSAKRDKALASEMFSAVEELLRVKMKVENRKANNSDDKTDRLKYFYGESLCLTLLIDLQIIKKKYTEGEE